MSKKLILVLAIFAFVATGAFAQLTFGVTGVQYYQEDPVTKKLPSLGEAWSDFADGTGVYWGGFGEIILDDLGIGLSFNQRTFPDELFPQFDMWNYDVNVYLAYHIFGGKAFLDPFLQAGLGLQAYDYKDKVAASTLISTVNPDEPLYGSSYFDFGLGLGVNLDHIGIFFKAMWNVESDTPLYETNGYSYPWPVMPFKWIFGAKVLL